MTNDLHFIHDLARQALHLICFFALIKRWVALNLKVKFIL